MSLLSDFLKLPVVLGVPSVYLDGYLIIRIPNDPELAAVSVVDVPIAIAEFCLMSTSEGAFENPIVQIAPREGECK